MVVEGRAGIGKTTLVPLTRDMLAGLAGGRTRQQPSRYLYPTQLNQFYRMAFGSSHKINIMSASPRNARNVV